jgi:hypothetical protein
VTPGKSVETPIPRDAREAERSSPEFFLPADHALCACLGFAAACGDAVEPAAPLRQTPTHVLPILAIQLTTKQIVVIVIAAMFAIWATSARAPRRRCRNCRELNREHANFCAQCGERLTKN